MATWLPSCRLRPSFASLAFLNVPCNLKPDACQGAWGGVHMCVTNIYTHTSNVCLKNSVSSWKLNLCKRVGVANSDHKMNGFAIWWTCMLEISLFLFCEWLEISLRRFGSPAHGYESLRLSVYLRFSSRFFSWKARSWNLIIGLLKTCFCNNEK
jgi:hypothetical protein